MKSMKKNIAIIPALLGSERVKDKNLLLVNGFPLIYYVVESCKKSGSFDDIYINSDDKIFKKMADQLGVKFYHRKPEKGGSNCNMSNSSSKCENERCGVHDHFLYDFIENVESEYLIQIHTTSPLLEPNTIKKFVERLNNENVDSLISTTKDYKESFINGDSINFDINKKEPTQNLSPIESISWAISGWNTNTFKKEYQKGPTFCGNFETFPISKIESIDIDNMDDLFIAEACLSHKKRKDNVGKQYYNENITSIESELQDLISIDGSPIPNEYVKGHNETIMNLEKIEQRIGNGDWCYPVVYTDNDQIAFIRQSKGNGCRKHHHPTKDEWWVIFRGEFEYKIWDNYKPNKEPDRILIGKPGDVVMLEKGTVHIISCISDEPGIRLACGERDFSHVYVK